MNLQPFSVLPIINDVIVNMANFSAVPDHKFRTAMNLLICHSKNGLSKAIIVKRINKIHR